MAARVVTVAMIFVTWCKPKFFKEIPPCSHDSWSRWCPLSRDLTPMKMWVLGGFSLLTQHLLHVGKSEFIGEVSVWSNLRSSARIKYQHQRNWTRKNVSDSKNANFYTNNVIITSSKPSFRWPPWQRHQEIYGFTGNVQPLATRFRPDPFIGSYLGSNYYSFVGWCCSCFS